ncbi:MAG: hypothetical protein ISS00_01395 [Candidatus Marinimicrobia bacterium]|nr:hypothetical protein [Candidatus Neomarinimicrobiota bacterium]
MEQKREKYYRGLFLFSAIYDLVLGVIFIFFFNQAFDLLKIGEKLPEFTGYISLIGAFLFVIGIAYYFIYKGDLYKNADLIAIGTLYKLAYCAIAFFYYATGNMPHIIFVALFGVLDLIMFLLMLECLLYLKKTA